MDGYRYGRVRGRAEYPPYRVSPLYRTEHPLHPSYGLFYGYVRTDVYCRSPSRRPDSTLTDITLFSYFIRFGPLLTPKESLWIINDRGVTEIINVLREQSLGTQDLFTLLVHRTLDTVILGPGHGHTGSWTRSYWSWPCITGPGHVLLVLAMY